MHCFCIFVRFPYQEKRPEFENNRRGRNGGTNSAIPHMIAREYRNIAPKFSQIPKPQLQMEKSWRCQYYKSFFQIEIILLCQCFQVKVRRSQACDKHKIIALVQFCSLHVYVYVNDTTGVLGIIFPGYVPSFFWPLKAKGDHVKTQTIYIFPVQL